MGDRIQILKGSVHQVHQEAALTSFPYISSKDKNSRKVQRCQKCSDAVIVLVRLSKQRLFYIHGTRIIITNLNDRQLKRKFYSLAFLFKTTVLIGKFRSRHHGHHHGQHHHLPYQKDYHHLHPNSHHHPNLHRADATLPPQNLSSTTVLYLLWFPR